MDNIEKTMKVFATTLEEVMPASASFALLTFDTNDPEGVGNCISNIDKEIMPEVFVEFAKMIRNKEVTPIERMTKTF